MICVFGFLEVKEINSACCCLTDWDCILEKNCKFFVMTMCKVTLDEKYFMCSIAHVGVIMIFKQYF